MPYHTRGARSEQSLADMCALLELSGRNGSDVDEIMRITKTSPDVATAVCDVMSELGVHSEVLQNKWHKHISQLWFKLHPAVPSCLNLKIMSHDVMCADALLGAHAILQELERRPAPGLYLEGRCLLTLEEERRMADSLLLFAHDPIAVRRMCAMLQELRLIRVVKSRLCVVKSRYKKFQDLPLSSQYYLLWHIDMYHLEWKEYVKQFSPHMAVFQQYLPMIWEMLEHAVEGQAQIADEFALHVVRAFRPLWQQEATKFIDSSARSMMGLYEQSMLQGMIEEWLLDKVFLRYGLIEYLKSNNNEREFVWTRLGSTLLHSERTIKLPCATDILD